MPSCTEIALTVNSFHRNKSKFLKVHACYWYSKVCWSFFCTMSWMSQQVGTHTAGASIAYARQTKNTNTTTQIVELHSNLTHVHVVRYSNARQQWTPTLECSKHFPRTPHRRGQHCSDPHSTFHLSGEKLRRLFRMLKGTVRWLCDQLKDKEGAQPRQVTTTIVTVKQYVLCAFQFFGVGSFQGTVATSRYSAVSPDPLQPVDLCLTGQSTSVKRAPRGRPSARLRWTRLI